MKTQSNSRLAPVPIAVNYGGITSAGPIRPDPASPAPSVVAHLSEVSGRPKTTLKPVDSGSSAPITCTSVGIPTLPVEWREAPYN
jgi:hypothetical protein